MATPDAPQALRFKCPKCAKSIRVPVSMRGKAGKCPDCGTSMKIPMAKPTKRPAKLTPAAPTLPRTHVLMIDDFVCDGMHHIRLLTKKSIAGGMVTRKKGPAVLEQLTQRHDAANVIKENAGWGQAPFIISTNSLKSVEIIEDGGACLTLTYCEPGNSKIKRSPFGLSHPSQRTAFVESLEQVVGKFHVHEKAQSIWEIGKTYLALSSLGVLFCIIPMLGGDPTEVTRGRNRLMAEFVNFIGPTTTFSIGLLFILAMLACWHFSCQNPKQVTVLEVDQNSQ